MIALQADPFASAADRKLTLATAITQVVSTFPGIFYAPQWWKTPDGCMSYRALWAYVQMVPSALALQRLSAARAYQMAQAVESGPQMADEDHAEAYVQ